MKHGGIEKEEYAAARHFTSLQNRRITGQKERNTYNDEKREGKEERCALMSTVDNSIPDEQEQKEHHQSVETFSVVVRD